MQPRGVDHRARPDRLGRCSRLEPVGRRVTTYERHRRQHDDVPVGRVAVQRSHQRLGFDDAGRRRPQRGARGDVWLETADEIAIDDLQVVDAVRAAACEQTVEPRCVVGRSDDDQLAAPPVRDVMGCAEPVEGVTPVYTQPPLERPRRIIDAGVDHPAVVGARLGAETRMTLEQTDRPPRPGRGPRARQTDNTAADDDQVDLFHPYVGRSLARPHAILLGLSGHR